MGAFVVILVLAADVFGRAISSGIVTSVAQREPMIHFITDSEQDACRVIADIFALRQDGNDERRMFQIEVEGHVFVGEQRVGYQNSWHVKLLGVMVNPYDIRKVVRLGQTSRQGTDLQGMEVSEVSEQFSKWFCDLGWTSQKITIISWMNILANAWNERIVSSIKISLHAKALGTRELQPSRLYLLSFPVSIGYDRTDIISTMYK